MLRSFTDDNGFQCRAAVKRIPAERTARQSQLRQRSTAECAFADHRNRIRDRHFRHCRAALKQSCADRRERMRFVGTPNDRLFDHRLIPAESVCYFRHIAGACHSQGTGIVQLPCDIRIDRTIRNDLRCFLGSSSDCRAEPCSSRNRRCCGSRKQKCCQIYCIFCHAMIPPFSSYIAAGSRLPHCAVRAWRTERFCRNSPVCRHIFYYNILRPKLQYKNKIEKTVPVHAPEPF